jgi:hypothetical protein
MAAMVNAPTATDRPPPALLGAEFAITLKGWRSQLRWAMIQREEDPARVWLEVISIDERSKYALGRADDPKQINELRAFRGKLEESVASLTEELGDEKLAPLYSWLDLVRQRRRIGARIDEARAAVAQARALRSSEAARTPKSEEGAAEQLARAQGELAQWQQATPPAPPPAVVDAWNAQGGEALVPSMPRDPMAVGRRGDAARRVLARRGGGTPGRHPWHGSKAERIGIPAAAVGALVFALRMFAGGGGGMAALTAVCLTALGALVARSVLVRRLERAELAAAVDWVWHARMYGERTRFAELEAGWLRALVDAHRALQSFDARPGTGGQLRDFERERPDLAPIVHEVVRDTEPPPS